MFGYSNRINWESFTETERKIVESLPHGSGIDYEWFCEKQKNDKVVCYNAYHGMDEYGGYVGSVDFSFRFNVQDVDSGRIMFHGLSSTGKRWVERWGLREYFPEVFFPLLDTHIERPCKYCNETGKRSIATLAYARNETIVETIATIQKNGTVIDWHDDTIPCWVCRGTGRLPVKD